MRLGTRHILLILLPLIGCGTDEPSADAGGVDARTVRPDGSALADSGPAVDSGSIDSGPRDAATVAALSCDSPGVVVCDGFEDGLDGWTVEGPAFLEMEGARVHGGSRALRVDFRDPTCGPSSCDSDGQNCFENYPQVVSQTDFDLDAYYVSWWVYYPSDFTFYAGPCLPARGSAGHFVRFANFHTPRSPDDSFYQAGVPDFGQYSYTEGMLGMRAEWYWVENGSGALTVGRNLIATEIPVSELSGRWNHYEFYADLGTPGGSDGTVGWAVNDVVRFLIADDAVRTGSADSVWGDRADEATAHPGLLRTSPEGFSRLGLVSNPNSSFGGRPGDVYWIDDVLVAESCPTSSALCR